jgi:hypothetical protein
MTLPLDEADLQKKEILSLRVNEYMRRAEQLKDIFAKTERRTTTTSAKPLNSQPSSRCDFPERNTASSFQELC